MAALGATLNTAEVGGSGAAVVDSPRGQRTLFPVLVPFPGNTGVTVSGRAYFVYLGKTNVAFIPKYVNFEVTAGGSGAQTAEVGFFSTPNAPSKAGQSLTKLVSSGTVDDLTTTGYKRNSTAFTTQVASGVHLWVGIRTAMATTQPTVRNSGFDAGSGSVLITSAAAALTDAGPWVGALLGAGNLTPFMVAELD